MFSRVLPAAAVALALAAAPARADRVRYHFRPADVSGNTAQASPGERVSYFGGAATPYAGGPRLTHLVTFRHPYTGQDVTVPLALPESTPRILHRPDRIIFEYSNYTVTAVFLPDGSVDTIYDSGPFRPLP
jgi:hypothetical protein